MYSTHLLPVVEVLIILVIVQEAQRAALHHILKQADRQGHPTGGQSCSPPDIKPCQEKADIC